MAEASSEVLEAQRRVRLALELYGDAEAIMRQNIRRANPGASSDEIDELLLRWISKRESKRPHRQPPDGER